MTPRIGKVAVVGLGYVGLPLACALARVGPTVGFDINADRVAELAKGHDATGEVDEGALRGSGLNVSADPAALADADAYVVAVPTPVDRAKRPDLRALIGASTTVGLALRARSEGQATPIVVFESTVYPGCTEEVCGPAIERASGLARGSGFKLAYSPERINPGDREHTLESVVKIVAGEDPETFDAVAELYGRVVRAGVYRAPDIRTAEAAKVIENTQRDLNIALMNELSVIFHRLGIDTLEVLKAAGTKWNFLPFRPGLVGGHCIPEDPYYLTHKAEEVGYHPQVILAGRRINDGMGAFVAQETVKGLAVLGVPAVGARVLVLGITFKENVPDVRNTRVLDVVRELRQFGADVEVHDPVVGAACVASLGLPVAPASALDSLGTYDVVVLAVPHRALLEPLAQGLAAPDLGRCRVVVDVKGALPRPEIARRGISYWTL